MRFHHFGEEAYAETERAIQQLLGVDEALVDVDADGFAAGGRWETLKSPGDLPRQRARRAAR